MDEVIEFILELLFEGIIYIGENKKISKWIRYPLMFIILLLVLSIVGLCIFLGIILLTEQVLGYQILGIILIICGIIFLYNIIKKVKNYWIGEQK